MSAKVLTVSLAEPLIEKIDQAAKEEFANRSEFIRNAVVERLRVINEYHARLNNVSPATEAELYELLKLKAQQRSAADFRKAWRREMRQTSKATQARGL